MPNWKKVILSGSDAVLNNITASGDISASGKITAANIDVGEDGRIFFDDGNGTIKGEFGSIDITDSTIQLVASSQVNLRKNGGGRLNILRNDSTTLAGDLLGEIVFSDTDATTNKYGAYIQTRATQDHGVITTPNYISTRLGSELQFKVMPNSYYDGGAVVFDAEADTIKILTLNAESGSIAHTKLRTPALILTPTSSESDPINNAIVYPQSGNMTPANALAITRTIGKDLKFGETEKGTILISSSFGGTREVFGAPAQQDVYIPFFKTPIKNSQVAFDWTITAINDDDEMFATVKLSNRGTFGNGHTEWYSGSLIVDNNVDFNTIDGVGDATYDDLDNNQAIPSQIFDSNPINPDGGDNASGGNYYLFNHKVDIIQDPKIFRPNYAHTADWNSSDYFYWGDSSSTYPFDVDNLLRRFRWVGPYNIDGEDHLYFKWENNTSNLSIHWRGVRLLIHIDYKVSNYRL